MGKESFILYQKHSEIVSVLTDEQAGQLLRAIFTYTGSGETIEMDAAVRVAFIAIRQDLDANAAKYSARCEGNKGGAPKGNQNASKNSQLDDGCAEEKQAKTTQNNLNNEKQPKTTQNNIKQPKTTKNNQTAKKRCDNDTDNDTDNDLITAPVVAVIKEQAAAAGAEDIFSAWEEASGKPCSPAEKRLLKNLYAQEGPERTLYGISEAVRNGVLKLSYVQAAARGQPNQQCKKRGRGIAAEEADEEFRAALRAIEERALMSEGG